MSKFEKLKDLFQGILFGGKKDKVPSPLPLGRNFDESPNLEDELLNAFGLQRQTDLIPQVEEITKSIKS